MAELDFDVAIAGYGPVGALTALELAHAGLRVVILERSTEPVVLPRAVGFDGESVRYFQRLGLGDEVAAILQPPREVDEVSFTDSKRTPLFGMQVPLEGHNGWRDIAFFDQPELEALLREFVAKSDRIETRMGCELTGFEQQHDCVVVRSAAVPGGAESALRAAYLIGSDGASSTVRGELGAEWQSLGYDQDWLVLDITAGPDAGLPLVTMQVCDPARLTTYVCVKDPNRRWEFQLQEGETREEMVRPEKIRELLAPWVSPEHYEIRRAAVYQFHAATADRWRDGRVLLAGDAAHQTPPFLGQGLNAGFRDAANLGWKIPLVLSGQCGDALLDTYAAERDAHARDLVDWAVAIGKLMETLAAREAGLPNPHPSVDQSSGYGQGRTAPPLRGGVLIEEQVEAGLPVGVLLRQPTVRAKGEADCRLDELLGEGFAVVARKQSDLAMSLEATKLLEQIGARTLCLDDIELCEGRHDVLFDTHAAAIIRPDRYVFGVVDSAWNLDRLLTHLTTNLHLRT